MIVILDNVRSMHNVGSIFRTCDAFMVKKLYLCGITAKPPHRDIQKTALGATKSVSWEYSSDTLEVIKLLKKNNYIICAIEQSNNSVLLQNFDIHNARKYALVFGNEVTGVHQDVLDSSDYIIEIPHVGVKKSFNVSVAAGIALWNFFINVSK